MTIKDKNMSRDEILEKLKFLQGQRQIAISKGLDAKIWDDEIKKLENELENLQ